MQRRIRITPQQWKEIWKDRQKTYGDYFVCTTIGNDKDYAGLLLFDTIEEAREFNKDMKNIFNTRFFPEDKYEKES